MNHHATVNGFSLIELLVALAVLGTVAVLVVPRFVSIQSQAQDTVATQIAHELNVTYGNWKGSGGTITGNPFGSMILSLIGNPDPARAPVTATAAVGGPSTVSDSGFSKNIYINLPAGLSIPDTSVAPPSNLVVANPGNDSTASFAIVFGNDNFSVIPSSIFNNLQWQVARDFSGAFQSGGGPGPLGPLNYNGFWFVIPESNGTIYGSAGGVYYKLVYSYDSPTYTWTKFIIYSATP